MEIMVGFLGLCCYGTVAKDSPMECLSRYGPLGAQKESQDESV